MDSADDVESFWLEVLARKHWTYHRLADVADYKGGEKSLAKRLLKMYRVSY
jgi:hypothetical protein